MDYSLQTRCSLKETLVRVFRKAKLNIAGLNFYETSTNDDRHYIFDERLNVLLGVNAKGINERRDKAKDNKHKFIKLDGLTFLIIYKGHKAQILGDLFGKIQTALSSIMAVRSGVRTLFTREFGLFIFDLMRMILDIRDGWFTPAKIITTLMSLYSIYDRFTKLGQVFNAQVYFLNDITFDSLVLMFSTIGVPKFILDIIKTFTDITGRKLFNSNIVMSIITTFYDLIKHFLVWMCTTIPELSGLTNFLESIIDYLFSTIVCYDKIRNVVLLYSKYVSDASVIMDPKFRLDCETLHDDLIRDVNFREYVDNSDNKHFKNSWDGFCNNLIKYIKNFDVARREEPICIVLEGQPGCGKSVLMNNLVEYLVRLNKSVYVHSVPPTMGGKDFYDDYENQDVFVMDDVGQQGVSQWRTIINFVAPIKYPLECADAKKKNTKFFNSKIIIVTTNKFTDLNSFTSSDCISEPGALFRRAHVINVSKGNSPSGYHTNDLKYLKYDYKDSQKFVNNFIYHNRTDVIPPSVEGLNTKDALIYVMAVLNHLTTTEEINRKSSILDDNEFLEIDKALDEIKKSGGYSHKPQFKFGDYFSLLRDGFCDYFFGFDIFDEWFTAIQNKFNMIVSFLCSFTSVMMGKDMDSTILEQRRILLAQDPYKAFGISALTPDDEVLRVWKRLSLKYHPDKANPGQSGLHSVIQSILNNAKDSIIHNKVFHCYASSAAYAPEGDAGASTARRVKDAVYDGFDYLISAPKRFYYWYFWLYECDAPKFYTMTLYLIYFSFFVASVIIPSAVDFLTQNVRNMDDEWKQQTSDNQDHLGSTGVKDMVLTEVTINAVKKSVRFVTGIRKNGTKFCSQAVVGGRFILMNSHTDAEGASINIYNTYDHFKNNHMEQESITVRKVKDYPSVDLCVYRLERTMLTYRAPRVLFDQKSEVKPFMYLVSSMGIIPMIAGKHFETNKNEISYTAYGVHFKHAPSSGLMTNVQGDGFCGTLMVNPTGAIVGVHVAGDGVSGFCVTPNKDIIESIQSYLNSPGTVNFDIDDRIKENFSGTRLRYDKDAVLVSHVGGDVPMVPSLLHRDYNTATRKLIGLLHHDHNDEYSSVPDKTINDRAPPNLTSRPAEKLKEMAAKSFKVQGFVTDEELDFIEDCIGALMPEEFSDITFEEAAFGGDLAAMATDTSNGYGHVKEKAMFFDFDNKKITDYGMQEFIDFKDRVEADTVIFKDFLSREVFKVDELRNAEKTNKPRTIRVMPITHIFWTKVICGQAAKHFKRNMHDTGICIGFNPYKDFHTLALKLKDMPVIGDADYGGWDGTLNARIMFRIFDVFGKRYTGKHRSILNFLGTSIVRSMVLVSDELYATTHGMPSGTWLTLLLNCLVNKAIQALTIYRNKASATVQDFLDIISYVTGDDDVFGTPDHLVDVFNLQTLKVTAESLGMTCTNGDKTEIITKGHDFRKLNYLKRHFRFHPVLSKYIGCLSLSTIINTFQYVNERKEYAEAMQGKINAVLVEAYLHSEALYYLLSTFFQEECPSYKRLCVRRIRNILNSDDGYAQILQALDKNYAQV